MTFQKAWRYRTKPSARRERAAMKRHGRRIERRRVAACIAAGDYDRVGAWAPAVTDRDVI
jgi:hypothetical protein